MSTKLTLALEVECIGSEFNGASVPQQVNSWLMLSPL